MSNTDIKPLILIVEDNKGIRMSARFVLEDMGYAVDDVEGPSQAKQWLTEYSAALLLLDMNFERDTTSGNEGLAFMRWYQSQNYEAPVVAMTAWSNTDLVVSVMQAGAGDFIEKPWVNTRLQQIVQQQLKLTALSRRNTGLSQQLQSPMPDMLWHSDVMQRLRQQLEAVAPTDANILLRGENGTGKSVLANWLHRHSLRSATPFVSVNMGAIPEHLFESEMFGHRKGAFTDAKEKRIGRFELADKGTLFLDEIATIPVNQQSKLLRVLESKEFEMVGSSITQTTDVRIISASNGEFDTLIEDGAFRRDLFFRLNTLEFTLPPLRERQEDIVELAKFYIKKHGQRYNKAELTLTSTALNALQTYPWPGNVRELSHMMERAVLLSATSKIDLNILNLSNTRHSQTSLPMMTLEEAERQLIERALLLSEGNRQQAAQLLGITKSSLYRRLEKYELEH